MTRVNTVFDQIVAMIDRDSTVLDLGCEDCSLLERLIAEHGVAGRGVEIDEASIQACIRKGISVFHGDLDDSVGRGWCLERFSRSPRTL